MSRRQLFPPPPPPPPPLPVLLPSLPAPPLPPWHFTLHIYRDLGVPAAAMVGLLPALSAAFPFSAVSQSALTVGQHAALTAACWDADREQLHGIKVLDVLEQQWSLQAGRDDREADHAAQAADEAAKAEAARTAAANAATQQRQRQRQPTQPRPRSWPQQPRLLHQPAAQQEEREEEEHDREQQVEDGEAELVVASLGKRQRRDVDAVTVRMSRGLWQRDAARCKTLRAGMFTERGLQREGRAEERDDEEGSEQEELRGGRGRAQLAWGRQSSDGGPADGDDGEQAQQPPSQRQQLPQHLTSAGRERKRPRLNNAGAVPVGHSAPPPAAAQARTGFISVATLSSSSHALGGSSFTASLLQQEQQPVLSSFSSSAVFCSYSRLSSLSHPNLLQPLGAFSSSSSTAGASTLRFSLFLTSLDCFVPGLTFVFGVARLCRCALVSTARLTLPTAAASAAFLAKESVHELGHLFGLHHCALPCVMTYSTSVEEAQRKEGGLCARCHWKVDWMRRGVLVRDMQPHTAIEQMRRFQHQQLQRQREAESERRRQQRRQQADDEVEEEEEEEEQDWADRRPAAAARVSSLE